MMLEIINSPLLLIAISLIPLVIGFIKWRQAFFRIFVPSFAITIFISQIIKQATSLPRPFINNPKVLGVASNIPQDFSFPSLHTAVSSVFAWLMTLLYPKLAPLWFGILAFIAFSRVSLGLHYTKDILAGFTLSTIIFWTLYLVYRRKDSPDPGKDLNVRRKLIHLFYGFILVSLLEYKILNTASFFVLLVLLVILVAVSPVLPEKCKHIIKQFEREAICKFLGVGPMLFTLSSFISWITFPTTIAIVSIINLALGDSVNALVGFFLEKKEKPKRIEASLASFLATFFVASQYISLPSAFSGCLVASVFEYTEIKFAGRKIDDNIFIPIISGAAMWFVEIVT